MDEPATNLPWSEQFRVVARQWVEADAAAALLEDTKSAVLAERMQEYVTLPVNRAEQMVKSSPEWKQHIEAMVEARKRANRLKVQMEYIKMKFQEWNSDAATRRAEMKL